METNAETASISEQRGAGGKLRKPQSRRPPATPYARPPQQRSRWLSRLVDPACRLISGGANRILPSLFSRSSEYALPAPDNQHQEDDYDKLDLELQENGCRDDDQHGECRTSGVSGCSDPSCTSDRLKNGSDFAGCKQDKIVDLTDNGGVSEIEQLIKGKTFSRDEINRLMEIINSRVSNLPEVEQENKYLSFTVRGDAKKPIAALENPRQSNAEKLEDLNKALVGTSSAVLQSSMPDKVGASPIEIARAYMGIRTSEAGIGSESLLTKDESASLNGDEFALKPFIPSPSPKPSMCWPGAMLHDQRGYLTPQNERGRFGLHNFPRTPYSRTIFSKSKSNSKFKFTQLQRDGNRNLNMSFAPLQQSQTPIYEQTRRKTLDEGRGSAGPIRRIRHKAVAESPSRLSVNFRSSSNSPLLAGGSSVFEGFLPAVKKNLEPGGTSSSSIFQSLENKPASVEVSAPTVHPHSSQMARTILEHLERNPPTPKQKSAELKLATSWKKTQSSTVPTDMPKDQSNSLHLGGFDSCRNKDQGENKNSAQWNDGRANTFFKAPRQENIKETKDSVNGTTSASNVKDGSLVMVLGDNVGPSEDFRNTLFSQIKSQQESDAKIVLNAADSEVPNLRKPPSHSSGNKPVLSSISIGKPGQNWTFSSDSTTGFTFPVSTSSGVSSEPPTPTIMASFSSSGQQQQNEGAAIPSYCFGLKKSTPAIVFSFPSTSGTSPLDVASDLKFNFGSDVTRRISFSSIGKDAVCY
ncbi:hypothetical protein Ddye_021111 [Dipteronia dyeriana]|uniref:Uncharacterized protein n=1 Tax=Dipteronia dyeriana TaxID=168575 RepID=A0AAD9WWL7_9ROSI|nr:hypothetical protein Ddye_021111 [Dipteronia dyeriana]